MSFFDDLARDLGKTIESLAQDVGIDSSLLESVVNDLASNGVDVFSMASKLGLTPLSFLRSVVNLMGSDPHQMLLQRLVGPIQPSQEPLSQLSQQWTQMATLHQNTAQTIQKHMDELLSGSGSYSYNSPAATTLLETNTTYQDYFNNALVDHAYTQGTRHALLANNVGDYLGQMPGKVYSLSTPMAALGALGFETVTSPAPPDAPPDWLNQALQRGETTEQDLGSDAEGTLPGPENPWWDILVGIMIIVGAILLLLFICWGVWWLWDHFTSHQNQQNSTSTPTPPARPTPTPTPVPKPVYVPIPSEKADARALAAQYGVDVALIEDLLAEGYTIDEIRRLLAQLKQNARTNDPRKLARYITYQLQQLIARWNNMTDAQYAQLRALGYTDEQIRLMLIANQVSVAVLIQRAQAINASGLEAQLRSEGYTETEIQQMLSAGFTETQLQTVYQRTLANPALMRTLLFGGTAPDGQPTGGIVPALLSGDTAKILEGQVALCLIDQVTTFNLFVGPGGATTEVDVGTPNTEIEVKQPGVGSSGILEQLQRLRGLYPGTGVVLFSPGYAKNNPTSAQGIKNDGFPIVGDCAQLRAAI